ncbi:MAG: amino acid ABC transporter permease [Variovorax sp.]
MNNWQRMVWDQRELFLQGFSVTLQVCGVAFVCALAGGLLLALLRMRVALLRPLVVFLIEFFRATPVLVQLLWVNYVWPELFGWPNTFFSAACVALALQSSGYLAETFRGALEAIPRGQFEAAGSLGLSRTRTFLRIVLPQMLLDAAPSIGNQFTVIVKSSALVSVIAVPDLMFESQKLVNRWYEPIEILTATAAIYIGFIFLMSWGLARVAGALRRRVGLTMNP